MKRAPLVLLIVASCAPAEVDGPIAISPQSAIGGGGITLFPRPGGVEECATSADCEADERCTGGACIVPTPVFDLNPDSTGSGIGLVTSDAFAMTTVVNCDARTTTTTNWACATGGTFTENNGDVTPGGAAPFTEQAARSNDYDRFRSHLAPSTSTGEVTATLDLRLRVVAHITNRSAVQYVASKYDSVNSQGWALRVTNTGVVQGVANATTFGSHQLDTFGEWNIYEITCSQDTCTLWVNGIQSGSTGVRSGTLATVTSAKAISIGCNATGANADCIDGRVSNVTVETCTGCIANASAATVQKKRANQAMGMFPTHAVTGAPATTDVRDTPAMIDIDRDGDGVVRWFRVGKDWLRVARRRAETLGGTFHEGYLAEPLATNLALRSNDFTNASWGELTAADSTTADIFFGPFGVTAGGDADMDRLVAAEDVVGVEHGYRQAVTLTAAVYQISVMWAYSASGSHKRYAFLRDNTIGATAIAYFDLAACRALTQGAGLSYDAGGFGPYAAARTQDFGTVSGVHFCRTAITVLGTAAAHDIDMGPAEADGDTTFTTTASQVLIGIGYGQVEQIARGYPATGLCPTVASTCSRDVDGLNYDIANYPTTGGTIFTSVLARNSYLTNGGSANNAAWICVPYKDANNYVLSKFTASTGNGVRDGTCTAGGGFYFDVLTAGVNGLEACATAGFGQWYAPATNGHDGQPHHTRLVYFTDDVRGYVDGDQVEGVASTAVDLPDLSGGVIKVGYESTAAGNTTAGLVTRCAMWDVETEPQFP